MAGPVVDSGITQQRPNNTSLTAIIVFIGLALYNVLELNFIIFATFKSRRSLYFWSFLVATWGIAVHDVGFLIKDLGIWIQPLYTTLILVGWYGMVTGQSFVLYSRLHIIVYNPKVLRAVLIMIIVDALICHVPITVFIAGANSANPGPWVVPYSIYEKIQVTIFFLQEFVISSLYIWETLKVMRQAGSIQVSQRTRRVMSHLLYVNMIIILLDTTILALEYASLYDVQTAYKGFAYSVKLKLEFSILNRLVEVMTSSRNPTSFSTSPSEGGVVATSSADVDRLKRMSTDPRRNGVQYEAYVQAESRIRMSRRESGNGVFKITEVTVNRGDPHVTDDEKTPETPDVKLPAAIESELRPSPASSSSPPTPFSEV
jgi:hypothetical protein